jgi:hypothetical protein
VTTVANPKVVITAEDKTARAFTSVRQSLRGMESAAFSARRALGSIGVGISVTAITTAFARAGLAAINYGDEVTKAAARTGTSASQFARLADAAKLADVDMQTLSKGLRTLNVALSEAGTNSKGGAAEAFRAIGLESENLRRLKPEQQLQLIADGIAGLPDAADKARAGVALFGRAWETLAPLLIDGSGALKDATAQIEKLGGAMTDEQLKKLSEADSAIKGLSQQWSYLARVITAEAVPALTTFSEKLMALPKVGFMDVVKGAFQPGKTGFFAADLLSNAADQARLRQQKSIPEGSFGRGASGSFGQVVKPPKSTSPGFLTPTTAPKAAKSPDLTEINISAKRAFDQAALQAEAFAQINEDASNSIRDLNTEISNENFSASEEFKRHWQEMAAAVKESTSSWSVFADEAGRSMQSSFANFLFDPFAEGLNGMVSGFVDTIRRMVAELAAQELLRAFFGWAGGALGGAFGNFVGGLAPRASGGPVTAGGAYLVGERGPEMFVPRSNGNIIPNGAMGGGIVMNYSIDARGADADRIMSMLPPLLKQTEERTVARVIDLQRRGRFA